MAGSDGGRRRRGAAGLALGALVLAGATGAGLSERSAGAESARAGTDAPPNFVVVVTDDQTAAGFNGRSMPYSHGLLKRRGTIFTDAVVTSPLCCPGRASFLTGQYTHNHGAWSSYSHLRRKRDHLASWLRAAGYRTGMVGKYLNSYDDAVSPPTRPAPGWDQWRMLVEPLSYYGYDVSVNGRRKHLGTRGRDYQTTYLNRQVTSLLGRWTRGDRPFLLWYAPHAPHDEKIPSRGTCAGRAVPAPGDLRRFGAAKLPRPPSFNERNVSDKPSFIRGLRRLGPSDVRTLEHLYRCRHASLLEVDRGVRAIVRELREGGDLNRTVLVFTSDNGLFYGEHRLRDGKRLPYREAAQVPFAGLFGGRALGGAAVGRVRAPVANIDLAPTLLELAGADPCRRGGRCRVMDGRSLVDLVLGDESGWPADRGRAVEMHNCRYSAVLAKEQLVVQHFTLPPEPTKPGGCIKRETWERYRLAKDPFQLRNLARGPRSVPVELRQRLRRLRKCAGIEGRDPVPRGGRSFCE